MSSFPRVLAQLENGLSQYVPVSTVFNISENINANIANINILTANTIIVSNIIAGNGTFLNNLIIPVVSTLPSSAPNGSILELNGNLFLGNGTTYNQVGNSSIPSNITVNNLIVSNTEIANIIIARQVSANVITQIPNTQNVLLNTTYDEPSVSFSNGAFYVNPNPVSASSWNTFTTPGIQDVNVRSSATGGNVISDGGVPLPKIGMSYIRPIFTIENMVTSVVISQTFTSANLNSTGIVTFEGGANTIIIPSPGNSDTFTMTAQWLNSYDSGAYRNVVQEAASGSPILPIPLIGLSPSNGTTVTFYTPNVFPPSVMTNANMFSYITTAFPADVIFSVTLDISAIGFVA